jgi:hypothetical protein
LYFFKIRKVGYEWILEIKDVSMWAAFILLRIRHNIRVSGTPYQLSSPLKV